MSVVNAKKIHIFCVLLFDPCLCLRQHIKFCEKYGFIFLSVFVVTWCVCSVSVCVIIWNKKNSFHLSKSGTPQLLFTRLLRLVCNYVPSHFIYYGCFNDNFRLVHVAKIISFTSFSFLFVSHPVQRAVGAYSKFRTQCESGNRFTIQNRPLFLSTRTGNDISFNGRFPGLQTYESTAFCEEKNHFTQKKNRFKKKKSFYEKKIHFTKKKIHFSSLFMIMSALNGAVTLLSVNFSFRNRTKEKTPKAKQKLECTLFLNLCMLLISDARQLKVVASCNYSD